MAQRQVKGVDGVMARLLTTSGSPPDAPSDVPASQAPAAPTKTPARNQGKKPEARRGRPPGGSRDGEPVQREKVSLRLRSDLAAAYREWSWEERCQFSDLVDKAMESFLKTRKKARMPERE